MTDSIKSARFAPQEELPLTQLKGAALARAALRGEAVYVPHVAETTPQEDAASHLRLEQTEGRIIDGDTSQPEPVK